MYKKVILIHKNEELGEKNGNIADPSWEINMD